jgi:uncharacterized SAM-binding protein YcdF (DUF218 family)
VGRRSLTAPKRELGPDYMPRRLALSGRELLDQLGWPGLLQLLVVAVVVVCLLQVILLAALTSVLFLWPPSDEPNSADAIVMLSGGSGDRLDEAVRLAEEGVAPVVVHAGNWDSRDARRLCTRDQSFEVICLRPDPDNTRTEARAVAELAEDRRWQSIAVVTSTTHVTRAGILFRRCIEGDVQIVESRPDYSRRSLAVKLVEEWIALLDVLVLERDC